MSPLYHPYLAIDNIDYIACSYYSNIHAVINPWVPIIQKFSIVQVIHHFVGILLFDNDF